MHEDEEECVCRNCTLAYIAEMRSEIAMSIVDTSESSEDLIRLLEDFGNQLINEMTEYAKQKVSIKIH